MAEKLCELKKIGGGSGGSQSLSDITIVASNTAGGSAGANSVEVTYNNAVVGKAYLVDVGALSYKADSYSFTGCTKTDGVSINIGTANDTHELLLIVPTSTSISVKANYNTARAYCYATIMDLG